MRKKRVSEWGICLRGCGHEAPSRSGRSVARSCMTAKFFVDTNVLVYAASSAAADQSRRDVALELLDRSDLALSAQVLAEFYAVATSKTKLNLTHDEAVVLLHSLARIPACPVGET